MTGLDSQTEEAGTAVAADAPQSSAPQTSRSPDPPPSRPAAPSPSWLGWVGILAVVLIVAAGSYTAFDLDRAGTSGFWVFAIAPTLGLSVVALVRGARDGELRHWLRPAWGDATRGILSAAILVAVSIAFVHAVAPAGSPRESWLARLYLQLGNPTELRTHVGRMAIVLVVAAAAEELVWRGLVTQLIAEQVGSRTAWAWAALPYALAHVPTVWALRDPEAGPNPLLVVAALGLGLVWGAMARQARRLTPAILSHAAFDWCVIMVFRLWGPGV